MQFMRCYVTFINRENCPFKEHEESVAFSFLGEFQEERILKRKSVGYLSPRSYLTVLNFKTPSVVGTVLKESALFV